MIYTMKNTFKYIALGIALLASSFALHAQYHEEGGMKTSKKVTGPEGGYYTISLESFATGETSVSETATPVDIVLVLDVSGSMNQQLHTYTARASQGYSYNGYGTNTYYYKHTDGNYYAVNRNDGRRLRFQVGNTWWYLSGTTATTTRPSQAANNNTIIWTGVLYTRADAGTKLQALKNAVQTFVNEVHNNATTNSDGTPRDPALTNQISVVKYAGPRYVSANGTVMNQPYNYDGQYADVINPGNHFYSNNYNVTEVVVGLTDVSTTDGVNRVMGTGNYVGVTDLQQGGATSADFGMYKARYVLETVKNRDSNKVVVLFTDGEPNHQSGFDETVASNTINNAKYLKDTYQATVFTIGVFDNETQDIRDYMNYTSSNYPKAENMDTPGEGGSASKGYYQNASGADLNEIFKKVAHASGAADATAGATTEVRDVISNSFILPEGDAAQVTIKVADVKSDNSGWEEAAVATGVGYEVKTVTSSTGEEHKELVVTGFDYTKADTYDENGFTTVAGNWVGPRYSASAPTTAWWAGKKLIIEFKIKANEEATGGEGTATNHPDSGIYVQQFDKDGKPILDEEGNPVFNRVNQYDVPHTPLPLLIRIQKDGLRHGESATFQLMKIRPKGWNDSGATIQEKMANVEYNALGKPKPNTHDFESTYTRPDGSTKTLDRNDPIDYQLGCGWEDMSKVIITNKGNDLAAVTKSLYGFDPTWIYMIIEDDWGWSYELTRTSPEQTTSDYEVNPFVYHNQARTENPVGTPIVKHAEAVTINHFKSMEEGSTAREEHYKSSKTRFENR